MNMDTLHGLFLVDSQVRTKGEQELMPTASRANAACNTHVLALLGLGAMAKHTVPEMMPSAC
jgi:hypothetical protein